MQTTLLHFSELATGALFVIPKYGHTYRKLDDACRTAWRGTVDGKAGRAQLVQHAAGFVAPAHFAVGTVVVVNRNTLVQLAQ